MTRFDSNLKLCKMKSFFFFTLFNASVSLSIKWVLWRLSGMPHETHSMFESSALGYVLFQAQMPILFFLKLFNGCLEKKKERRRKRTINGRGKHQLSASCMPPTGEQGRIPDVMLWPWIELATSQCMTQCPTNGATPAGAGSDTYFHIVFTSTDVITWNQV